MFKKVLLFFIIVLPFACVYAQTTQTIRGRIIDTNTEQPLAAASVTLKNTKQGTQTDENGYFRLEKVQVGRYQIEISSVGYEMQTISEILVESGKEIVLEIRLQEATKLLGEAQVKAPSNNLSGSLTSIHTITTEQIFRYPGTYLDPARLASAYAGVANSNDQANGMVIRGNSPNGMQWRLEGVEIVNPNHLSNAGTFSDRVTQNSGGVNILSVQLLGNMNFLTGAFPAEFGNALSGVMDMRLRKGNNQKHEFTAQAGLIGLDVAAEGPFSKTKKNGSYLVNYRYSFTGLLGLMGVTFGGEDITFQDLSFNISLPTTKAGSFAIFGMGGLSSNYFEGNRDVSLWEVQKDGYDINYTNKMGALGATHSKNIGNKLLWRTVLVGSGLESVRKGYMLDKTTLQRQLTQSDSVTKSRISVSSALSYKINSKNLLKVGAFITHQSDAIYSQSGNKEALGKGNGYVLQPYANWQLTPVYKLTANIGLHYLNYTVNKTQSLEPRVSVGYQLTTNQSLSIAYGLHSQLQLPQVYFGIDPSSQINKNLGLNFTKAHHYVLSHQYYFKSGSYFKTELFYQKIFNAPVKVSTMQSAQEGDGTFSTLNLVEDFSGDPLQNKGTGQNYGIELTYQQYLTNGFYTLVNGTLYNATYIGGDGIKRNSRYNGKHIFNLTAGKEWNRSKNRTIGASIRVIWLGGFFETPINEALSQRDGQAVYETSKAFTIKQPDYFRPDLRVYLKKSKQKYARTLALDLQNVAGHQNIAYSYYDVYQKKVVKQYQLGLIPILSYRWEF
ncbi:TonB-dependent receptor [Emticicia sp. 21SJ11W-3]|uniref:TonB-dependent receptor n=1 Tax=Emticicia sp. 21SJ11W-3 TaxID=2916755 RepID=UPI0020A1D807|nr:TonB-dependent receptor [Emticicia sp. 21SJ11W-3]UTA69804.1 TonB-dependent receptor [Emticicia sp. 21SJ11W-3]